MSFDAAVLGRWRWRTALVALMAGAMLLAGCGSSSNSSTGNAAAPGASTSSASTPPSASTIATSRCGSKPGVRATGTPIRLGAIVTKQPGTDFTDIANMAKAYFTCVNANGGVNGHPIDYVIETEQTQPAQIAADAAQLVGTDHVIGIVGNTSILECTVDHAYWERHGYDVIDSGIAPECWSTPNSAAVNMGPRFSSDGALQYALAQHVSKIIFDQSNVPGWQYGAAGAQAVASASHVPVESIAENVPIQDANSVALREVNAAGPSGAVVLDFTPPEALVILQAAQKLGLENRVKVWACSTPCNTDFLARALGPKWNHKQIGRAHV